MISSRSALAINASGRTSRCLRIMQRNHSTALYNNFGIVAMDTYFPRKYVAQEDLEAYDGVSPGKYTVGLGQKAMAFCDDHEDINSLCLNAVSTLLERHNIDPCSIGRLEVGTETIVDKSKSVKTTLMELFEDKGNTDIEGVDTTNACYGGTNALFNALHWLESSYWDGRYALVVAADIAVYEKGPARPTGGAGAVAMLLGPDATLVFENGIRGTYMENAWDFYKPVLPSEYPLVDGKLSNDCYLRAVDKCFSRYAEKFEAKLGKKFSLDEFDHALFHSPYSKLVQKSWARFLYLDYMRQPEKYPDSNLVQFAMKKVEETYNDRDMMKVALNETRASYKSKVEPSLLLGYELGNSYCGSLYCSVQSLIETERQNLLNKRVGLFSYGSGLAASLFSLKVQKDPTPIAERADIAGKLKNRIRCTPEEFTASLLQREKTHNIAPYQNGKDLSSLYPNSYYLHNIDDLYRRYYKKYVPQQQL